MNSIQAIICDFSGVILTSTQQVQPESLSRYYSEQSAKAGFIFRDHFQFNQPLIDFFKTHLSQLTYVLFSNSELVSLSESDAMLGGIFDIVITPDGIGYTKSQEEAYEVMSNILEIQPQHILYIDDEEMHVKAALKAGLQATHFHNTEKLILYLQQLIPAI